MSQRACGRGLLNLLFLPLSPRKTNLKLVLKCTT
ncbi:unnamed protein product [Ectocarpus sp. CCAP 1310/34]|nr:unnamed protein product [Ectocarpus sp. CCAP 1310/34]